MSKRKILTPEKVREELEKDDIIFDAVIKPVWDKLPFGK